MKTHSTRQVITLLIAMFEIAVFVCDFYQILLLPNSVIKLIEFSLFVLMTIISLIGNRYEIKNLKRLLLESKKIIKVKNRTLSKKNLELSEMKKELDKTNYELRQIKGAANRTKTSPIIIKEMRASK